MELSAKHKHIPFNINDNVRVKLTNYGREVLLNNHNHRKIEESAGKVLEYTPPKEDENGWSEWQLWRMMQEFGEHFYNGCQVPFEALTFKYHSRISMSHWKEFTGSGEQIKEITNSRNGFKIRYGNGQESKPGLHVSKFSNRSGLIAFLHKSGCTHYMIPVPHPHERMIIEWAKTQREVYAFLEDFGRWKLDINPMWHPNVKYSFNPDGDEQWIING